MKFVESRPYADPDAAARELIEFASTIEPAQDGRVFIERAQSSNVPFWG